MMTASAIGACNVLSAEKEALAVAQGRHQLTDKFLRGCLDSVLNLVDQTGRSMNQRSKPRLCEATRGASQTDHLRVCGVHLLLGPRVGHLATGPDPRLRRRNTR